MVDRCIILYGGLLTKVSEEDYFYLLGFKWHMHTDYAARSYLKQTIYMHVEVARRMGMDLSGGKEIDHITDDKLNNKRDNLQPLTHQDNIRKAKLRKVNTSGTVGVYSRGSKFIANIGIDGITKYIGIYDTQDEATAARKAAELRYWKKEK